MTEFDGFKALSFDCYGTLIDWETGIAAQLGPWAERHGVDASADELMSVFASVETDVESEACGKRCHARSRSHARARRFVDRRRRAAGGRFRRHGVAGAERARERAARDPRQGAGASRHR